MDFTQTLQIILHFDQHLGNLTSQYGVAVYVMLFAIIFCEIGVVPLFFLPGDPLVFLCGAFCASGALSLWVLLPVLYVATVGGSALSYATGARVGVKVFNLNYRWLDKSALNRSHTFYEKHGQITFLMSPYIAVVRTFAPFIAGVSSMSFSRFMLSVNAGAALWIGGLALGGYFFGNQPIIRDHMNAIVLSGIGLGVGGLLASGLWRYVKARRAG